MDSQHAGRARSGAGAGGAHQRGLADPQLLAAAAGQPGFAPQNTLAMSLALPATKYKEPAQRANFYKEALQRIRALPGVQSAGAVSNLPLSGDNSSGSFRIEGREVPQGNRSRTATVGPRAPTIFRR